MGRKRKERVLVVDVREQTDLIRLGLPRRTIVALRDSGVDSIAALRRLIEGQSRWSDYMRGLSRMTAQRVEEALLSLDIAAKLPPSSAREEADGIIDAPHPPATVALQLKKSRRDLAVMEVRRLIRRWRIDVADLQQNRDMSSSDRSNNYLVARQLCIDLIQSWSIAHSELFQ